MLFYYWVNVWPTRSVRNQVSEYSITNLIQLGLVARIICAKITKTRTTMEKLCQLECIRICIHA